jgi:outer membrane lipoprotein-sorting protein
LKNPGFVPSAALFLCIAAATVTSQETGLLARVTKNYSGAVALTTTFDVKIVWKVREKEETKHGKIVWAPADRFRIELGDSKWVCDGATVWQCDNTPSLQVIIRRLSSCDPSQLPSRMLSRYLTSYAFKEQKGKEGTTVFAWSFDSSAAPQKGEARSISFTVDPKTAVVRELLVVDKSGNESTYRFRATTFAAPPKEAFSFDVPKGARVLDER